MTTKPFWMESTWKHEFYNQRLSSSPRRTRFPVRCKLVESNLLVCRVMPQNGRWFLSFQVSTVLFLKVSLICCHFNIISTFSIPILHTVQIFGRMACYLIFGKHGGFQEIFDPWNRWLCQDDLTDMIDGLCSVKKKEGSASLESQKRDGLLSRLNLGTGRIGRFLFSWKKSMSLGTSNRRNVWYSIVKFRWNWYELMWNSIEIAFTSFGQSLPVCDDR